LTTQAGLQAILNDVQGV